MLSLATEQWAYHAKRADELLSEQHDWRTFNAILDRATDVLGNNHLYSDQGPLKIYSSFHLAVARDLRSSVSLFCQDRLQINALDDSGHTPLQVALIEGSQDAAKLLLSNIEVNIMVTDEHDSTLLHTAASKGFLSIAEDLLKRGIFVDSRTKRLQTPLHIAAHQCHVQLMALLLDWHADIEATDEEGKTPLQYVIQCNTWQHNIYSEPSGEREARIPAALKLLVQRGASAAQDGSTGSHSMLGHALETGRLAEAELLLKAGASIDQQYGEANTLLFMILEAELPINEIRRRSMLSLARFSKYRNTESMQWLEHTLSLLAFLLEHHADVNLRNVEGTSALLLATRIESHRFSKKAMLQLLKHGSNPNHKDDTGRTILYSFAHRFFPDRSNQMPGFRWADGKEILVSLIQHGVDVNIQDTGKMERPNDGRVLSLAASCAKTFLIDPRITDWHPDNNRSIVEEDEYVVGIYLEIIKLLLDAGAKVGVDGNKFQDLFAAARKYGNDDLVHRILTEQHALRSLESSDT